MRSGPAGRRGRRRRAVVVVAAAAAGATSAVASGGLLCQYDDWRHARGAYVTSGGGGGGSTVARGFWRHRGPRVGARRSAAVPGGDTPNAPGARKMFVGWVEVGGGGRLSPNPLRWCGNVIVVILSFPARSTVSFCPPSAPPPHRRGPKIEIPRHNTIIRCEASRVRRGGGGCGFEFWTAARSIGWRGKVWGGGGGGWGGGEMGEGGLKKYGDDVKRVSLPCVHHPAA